ncbi:hypothetical protein BKA62DRAFT_758658 [Auriculariales sp. MPI-PUGE-AT-0066]|nr:hypothetical protein BKA62DRAFT_758658 [Auriculariales sp. MPI-PUGE-AT-0066]
MSSQIEWNLHIRSNEHELGQSYSAVFFLGPVPASPSQWRTSDKMLGMHVSHTFSGDVPVERDTEIESFIPLQRALKRLSGLDSLTPEYVVPYLRETLRWGVQKANAVLLVNGDVVQNDALSSLKVEALSQTNEQKRAGQRSLLRAKNCPDSRTLALVSPVKPLGTMLVGRDLVTIDNQIKEILLDGDAKTNVPQRDHYRRPQSGQARQTPYPRRPIEELVKDQKQFSLYVQAMAAMMAAKSTDMTSWFQVAGIHGLPSTPWDNVGGVQGAGSSGYCTHASVLFPTWHRAYILLYEQALVTRAITIASQYKGPDAAEWQQAASALRVPYWDWAVHAIPPAEVIELQTLTVQGPNGQLTLNPNPLLGYVYHPGDPKVDPRPKTVRCPSRSKPTETDLRALKDSLRVLDNPNDPMRDRVYNTLDDADTWQAFSNKRTSGGAFRNSLESCHDTLHVLIGGDGQMSDPGVAAFDPLFWLHHTNVDRLLSLWQALHKDVWVNKVTDGGEGGTFSMRRGTPVDAATDLTPFWNAQSSFHKSNNLRDTKTLNYTYPEFLQVQPGQDPEAIILAAIQRLYLDEDDVVAPVAPPPAGGAAAVPKPAPAPAPAPAAPKPTPVAAPAPTPPKPAPAPAPAAPPKPPVAQPAPAPAPAPAAPPKPPVAQPAAPAAPHAPAASTPGKPPVDQFPFHGAVLPRRAAGFGARLAHCTNLVAIHSEFVNKTPADCENCQQNAADEVITEGFVRLTRALRLHGVYGKSTNEIDQYLQDKLEWRIQKIDGKIIPVEEADGLWVEIMTRRHTPGHKAPIAIAPPSVHHVTRGGLPKGARHTLSAKRPIAPHIPHRAGSLPQVPQVQQQQQAGGIQQTLQHGVQSVLQHAPPAVQQGVQQGYQAASTGVQQGYHAASSAVQGVLGRLYGTTPHQPPQQQQQHGPVHGQGEHGYGKAHGQGEQSTVTAVTATER